MSAKHHRHAADDSPTPAADAADPFTDDDVTSILDDAWDDLQS